MDQKERDTQRALGNMEEFRVSVVIPIKVNVQIAQNVEAVSEEDAIEQVKILHDIIPDIELLRDALSKARASNAEFDTSVKRAYGAKSITSGPFGNYSCDNANGGS